ncbi:MAG: Asp-tRNA(Asn)/Glu-tRNA(Gln) amidotransferase subunit GatB [Tenericutes bacterium]|nr:Asp-tRNA(Asn)/Glu-tRNA(Gln) amidotransferase subunit GatB [Mycoplasmatota bacterium]
MKYKAMIGLEMHCEISKTNSKVFSPSKNEYSDVPNSSVGPIDLAFPGILPLVNKKCVSLALKASMILNCKQPEYIYFERKNYYYPDLPKGYQITQETKPIPVGIYGKVKFMCNDRMKEVRVNNIHLEEDAASLDHYEKTSNIDYNRAGVPLLELVTEPDLHSADEAVAFLEHMRSIYRYADISEADSKKGQVRCDVNVSIMESDKDETDPKNWGTKIEIKNVNSFGAVRDVINYEIKRQTELKENGTYDEMEQQTRRWDSDKCETVYMRNKANAIDYKYFVEPNIPKFKITKEYLESIRKTIPELADEKRERYIKEYDLSDYDAGVLTKEKSVADYFEKLISLNINAKTAANWVTGQILAYINKNDVTINKLYMTPERLKVIIENLENNTISIKQAKEIFTKVLDEKKEPNNYISKDNAQISDKDALVEIIDTILENNPKQIEDYKNGRTNLFDYFVGQVMKETRGKANPVITKEILKEKL